MYINFVCRSDTEFGLIKKVMKHFVDKNIFYPKLTNYQELSSLYEILYLKLNETPVLSEA
jgi:hypothetical protein